RSPSRGEPEAGSPAAAEHPETCFRGPIGAARPARRAGREAAGAHSAREPERRFKSEPEMAKLGHISKGGRRQGKGHRQDGLPCKDKLLKGCAGYGVP